MNPRKADLHRWRETFAEKLRGWGIDAEATRQPTRGVTRNYEALWRLRAREEGRLRYSPPASKTGSKHANSRSMAAESWAHILNALVTSESAYDRKLANAVARFVKDLPVAQEILGQGQRERLLEPQPQQRQAPRDRGIGKPGPDISR